MKDAVRRNLVGGEGQVVGLGLVQSDDNRMFPHQLTNVTQTVSFKSQFVYPRRRGPKWNTERRAARFDTSEMLALATRTSVDDKLVTSARLVDDRRIRRRGIVRAWQQAALAVPVRQ